jgi:hypothetical protein
MELTLEQRGLEAQSPAAIVAGMLGIEHSSAQDYILMYKRSPEGLRHSLGVIHRVAGRMATLLRLDELRDAPPAHNPRPRGRTPGRANTAPRFSTWSAPRVVVALVADQPIRALGDRPRPPGRGTRLASSTGSSCGLW